LLLAWIFKGKASKWEMKKQVYCAANSGKADQDHVEGPAPGPASRYFYSWLSSWVDSRKTQCPGIKNFIVAIIIKTSSDEVSLEKNRTLLGKLNIVLVQVMNFPRVPVTQVCSTFSFFFG
jgi:hypothetical protein